MSKPSLAGAAALLSAPVVVIASVLASTTLSDDASSQVAAFADHRGAMIAGAVLEVLSIVLLMGGIAWLAIAVAPRARGLALAGGVLGLLGSFVVLFEDGVHAAVSAVVAQVGPAHAVPVVDAIQSSAAVAAVEPLSLLGDIGLALLGAAAVRAGAPRWAGVAIAVGALAEGAGFATGTKAVVIAAFCLLFAGAAAVVGTFAARPEVAYVPASG